MLNAIPIEQYRLDLSKEEFRDALKVCQVSVHVQSLLTFIMHHHAFIMHHASCKKGGFFAKRHDNIKVLFTTLLNKVCTNVQSEPHLIPLDNDIFNLRTANTSEEARLDIKANGFWQHGQTAFFDVRITHVNSMTNTNRNTQTIFREHEQAKKRKYIQRVLEIEHAFDHENERWHEGRWRTILKSSRK